MGQSLQLYILRAAMELERIGRSGGLDKFLGLVRLRLGRTAMLGITEWRRCMGSRLSDRKSTRLNSSH